MPMPTGNLHFTAYQNDAENFSDNPNALILPIPGKTSPENFIDTTLYNEFLNEIVSNMTPRSRSMKLASSKGMDRSFEAFELGQYTIGLTASLEGMHAFIRSVAEEKRPRISMELLQFFATHYKGWSFAICLFSSTAKMKSQPIAYTYEPFNPKVLFYPTMDSHTGLAPKKENEPMDHVFILPANNRQISDFFTQNVPDFIKLNSYRLEKEYGFFGKTNGDCYVQEGKLEKIYDFKELLTETTV